MKNGKAWVGRWRQLTADVSIGAATLIVALATAGAGDVPFKVLIAAALIGVSWLLERGADAQPVADFPPQLRSPKLESAQRRALQENFHAQVTDAPSA